MDDRLQSYKIRTEIQRSDTLPDDLYTSTLVEDMKASLTRRGIRVAHMGDWSNVSVMCQETPRATAIFASRSVQFDSFITTVVSTCGDNQPAVIVDDSVNRFVASDGLRDQPKFNRPLIYVAKSTLVTCNNKGVGHQDWASFYALLVQDTGWNPCGMETEHPFGE